MVLNEPTLCCHDRTKRVLMFYKSHFCFYENLRSSFIISIFYLLFFLLLQQNKIELNRNISAYKLWWYFLRGFILREVEIYFFTYSSLDGSSPGEKNILFHYSKVHYSIVTIVFHFSNQSTSLRKLSSVFL